MKKDGIFDIKSLKIEDLVDGRSRAVMEHLNLSWQWKTNEEYELDAKFVSTIPCVNDACERACHLTTELNQQGPRTEKSRQANPKQRKSPIHHSVLSIHIRRTVNLHNHSLINNPIKDFLILVVIKSCSLLLLKNG